jgi:hypothetical protein
MKLSEMVKKLNSLKKEHGDVEVYVDLKNIEDNGGHDEYNYEADINFRTAKIGTLNMDTQKVSKPKKSVVLYICDGVEF